jgi:uncharacterized protein (DUF1501 family)
MADCCDDFTRSHLVRGSIARAGTGLPVIEPGMPVPAGTGLTRRSVLLRSAGLALAVYGAGRTLTPQAFDAAVAEAAGDHKVLVSIFMDGGADSLSLLAPVADPIYVGGRPTLRLAPGAGATFGGDSRLQWHPSAQGLKELWDASGVGVAVAPAIGYDSPNQSHFTSRHFWEVGATDANATTGWLGRYLDRVGSPNVPIQGLSLDSSLSPQLATETVAVAATDNLNGYQFQMTNVWGAMQTRMRTGYAQLGACSSVDPITAQARQAQANSAQLSADLASIGATGEPPGDPQYPTASSGLQTRLKAVAQLLATTTSAGDRLPVRCVTLTAQGSYDTHSNQATQLSDNLLSTAANIRAFWKDLELRGLADRVVITLWSEFGRRLAENGSGTDHGAAGAAFVIGKNVRQGLIGEFPGLASGTGGGLDPAGNLRATADFRGLYCSLLEQWFQTEAAGIIPSAAAFARPVLF